MIKARKTENRLQLFDCIEKHITKKQAYTAIDYKSYNESRIKQSLQHFLVRGVTEFYTQKGYEETNAEKAAYENVLWEGTPTQTIHHKTYLGCKHRPDFQIKTENLDIAVEVKIGGNGESLRSGLGQALVYSQVFDFVIYLFVDNSPDNRIRKASTEEEHKRFIGELWDRYNIKFSVV